MRPYRNRIALLETDAFRWTRSCVPIFRYSSCCTTTDAQTERPYRNRIALLETDAFRWARSCVPIFRYSSRCTTTDAQTVRPYRNRIALLETDAFRWTRSCVPIFRYSSCCTTTDAQTVRPYRSRIALMETGAFSLDTSRAPPRRATGLIGLVVRCPELRSQCWLAHLKKKKSIFATSSAVTYRQIDKKSYDLRKKGRISRDIDCG